MAITRRLDPEALYTELRRALRHGARASRLVRYSPELVEMLCPADQRPDLTVFDRARRTEELLRRAISAIGGSYGEAAAILLCLAPGTLGLTLEQRRQRAGQLLGKLPDTFRRARHEGLLLWDLVGEVWSIVA